MVWFSHVARPRRHTAMKIARSSRDIVALVEHYTGCNRRTNLFVAQALNRIQSRRPDCGQHPADDSHEAQIDVATIRLLTLM